MAAAGCLLSAAGCLLSAVCPPLVTAPQPVTLTIKLIAAKRPSIYCGASRHHHPLNPLNPWNLLNPEPRSGSPYPSKE